MQRQLVRSGQLVRGSGQLVRSSHRLGDEAVVVDVHVLQLGEDLRLVRAHLGHRP